MKKCLLLFFAVAVVCGACKTTNETTAANQKGKVVIYQVFTRLFGNTDTTFTPWGTLEQNGVGKLADFTDTALDSIKALGATHIWYTGVPHHAVITDYSAFGISNDDPDVVKGRAGSPYAVKDYYNVDPDLATNVAQRLQEFTALVNRTHQHGLKVIIDIVPNHIARRYVSLNTPDSVKDFGATDDTTVAYAPNNNFYYIPGQSFKVPASASSPLGGAAHFLSDGKFAESPAKWTGNGSRLSQPDANDWYETVKINYGVRPDGSKDFDTLPAGYAQRPVADHYAFWQDKTVPLSWKKFRDIALFWLNIGVDGFRFDMAEMVPVEFWSYMNSAIKTRKPSAEVVGEIYNPAEYDNYINLGKIDYLYDKVDTYDRLHDLIQGHGNTDSLFAIQQRYAGIEHHLLHFLENHDELRIASPQFAGDPLKALPAMVVSATMGSSPVLVYFGQEVGEPGNEMAGFGQPGRTSIFDYIGVPHHQRWMNNGKFDRGKLTPADFELREFYRNLLNFTNSSSALMGQFTPLHQYNREHSTGYTNQLYAFARSGGGQKIIVLVNFSDKVAFNGRLLLPPGLLGNWGLQPGNLQVTDVLHQRRHQIVVANNSGSIDVDMPPLGYAIFVVK